MLKVKCVFNFTIIKLQRAKQVTSSYINREFKLLDGIL